MTTESYSKIIATRSRTGRFTGAVDSQRAVLGDVLRISGARDSGESRGVKLYIALCTPIQKFIIQRFKTVAKLYGDDQRRYRVSYVRSR